jgi:hypothetical protein
MTPDQCTASLQANGPEALKGRIAFATESDNNRCVPRASRALNQMNAQGEVMGWQFLQNGYEDVDGETWHAETLVRLPYFKHSQNPNLDGSYFISAFSHSQDDTPYHSLGVAQLGFKTGNQGRMLLTNRAFGPGDHSNSGLPDWEGTPHPNDGYVHFGDGTTLFTLDPQQNHPGGGSALGWYAVIGMQRFDPGLFGTGTPTESKTKAVILNLYDPRSPTITSTFVAHQDPVNDQGNSALSAAITKLNNGHFLLAIEKDFPNAQIEFYVSTLTTLDDPHPFGDDGRTADTTIPFCSGATKGADNPVTGDIECFNNPYGWQSFNFVNDCNGDLYVLGMRGDIGCDRFGSGPCNDVVDNFQVQVQATNTGAYAVQMTSVDQLPSGTNGEPSKHMYCPDNSGNDQCDFQAAAGSYVDPQGQVIIYSSNYDPDGGFNIFSPFDVYGNGAGDVNGPWFGQSCMGGTCPPSSGFYRGMEFHQRHGNAAVGSACPTWDNAWVEFYEQVDYNEFGDGNGQVFRSNYVSRDERDGYLGSNDFNDKAHSVRWCVPPGSSVQIFKDLWQGGFTYLNGSGQVMEAGDLNNFTYPYSTNGTGLGDSVAGAGSNPGSISTFQFVDGHSDPNGINGAADSRN